MDVSVTPTTDFTHDELKFRFGRSTWLDQHLARDLERAGLLEVEWPPKVVPMPAAMISRRWEGSTVVCLASGDSLTVDDCETVRKWVNADRSTRKAIAVCTTFRRALWADVTYACDGRWWDVYGDECRTTFGGECWIGDPWYAYRHKMNVVTVVEHGGLSRAPGRITSGGNSGHQALGLAYMWGAARIILLGYDFQATNGRNHWHGDHEKSLPNPGPFADWLLRVIDLGRELKEEGVDVVNCSRATAITCFRREPLKKALDAAGKAVRRAA